MLGSRVRTRQECLESGMPLYKYLGNRFLTFVENICLGQNMGEFHSGFRAYRRAVLERLPLETLLRRLRVRLAVPGVGGRRWIQDRRDTGAGALHAGGFVDQLRAVGEVRAGDGRAVAQYLAKRLDSRLRASSRLTLSAECGFIACRGPRRRGRFVRGDPTSWPHSRIVPTRPLLHRASLRTIDERRSSRPLEWRCASPIARLRALLLDPRSQAYCSLVARR